MPIRRMLSRAVSQFCQSTVALMGVIAGLVFCSLNASKAQADFIIHTFSGSSEVYTLNPDTGATTLLGLAGVQLTDVALAPGGQLYGASLESLYSLNPTNGAATLIGSFGATTAMLGLDFGAGGQLYGISGTGGFLVVSPSTGAATLVFSPGIGFQGDVAHAGGNIFYATSNSAGGSHLIELNAGAMTTIDRGLIATDEYCPGLDFDLSGRLIAMAISGKSFLIPNYSSSGAGALLSNSGIIVAGATTLPVPLPEPSALLLLSCGLMGLLRQAGRRRGTAKA